MISLQENWALECVQIFSDSLSGGNDDVFFTPTCAKL